eukprot:Gregarina_sp_Pseudo_9__5813@NODE_881_length_2103_cov_13_661822_g827_i0_p1_GENE_NODE_881_length_2103_cov_13_661822_g827_i0NODE_881_length_2103_cov_13_661822_g827_i0_p1_ORF_typecomplete_len594_score161_44Secapin/PF17521_2/2_7Secapin/PF17521_2/1_1e03Secapin/PF17521_2/3_3e02Secapin/PF17521_2/1_1e03CBM_14/PF01607_24/97CBM_14/PF01607_24/80CBM_14/PF01607_24/2_1e03CBM_14/PF01607_24/18CBM_14/PF01607_24/2_1CBM_14/PF01607_24/4_6e03CBM_14/PF01607_24/9_8e02_NODE_881_length_2103_cov_13_661822_g827_i02161997
MSLLSFLFVSALALANGSTAPGRSVVSVVPVERKCPNRKFHLADNDVCVMRDTAPPDLVCRAGARLEQGQCYIDETFSPERICPPGSKFNGNECEQTKTSSVNMTCEDGDELINGECLRIEVQPTKPSCPKGYQMSVTGSGRCEATTFTTPDFVCPADFSPAPGGGRFCERLAHKDPVAQCPPGTFLHEQMCVSALMEGQASKRCASGGEMDAQGRCVSVAQVEPDVVCAPGFAFNSGRCEKPQFNQPRYRCPKDYVLQGDTCIQTIPAEPYCSSEEKMTALGTCVGIQHRDPTRACPQRSVPGADGRCVVQVIYENDLELTCGDRYALVDGRCLKKVKTTDALTCASDFTLNKVTNVCELRETTASEPHCAGNAVYDEEIGSCVTVMTSDVMVTCPRGTEYNPDIAQCHTKKMYTPAYSCPEGMSLKRGLATRNSNPIMECVQHSMAPAQTSCSGMGELNARGQCLRTLVQVPDRRCAPGFALEHEVCVHTEEAAVIRTCPEGFKHVGNACVGKVPAPEPDTQLSNDDRQALQEVVEGMALNKRNPSFRRAASDKDRDAALLGLVELAAGANTKLSQPPSRNNNVRAKQSKQ